MLLRAAGAVGIDHSTFQDEFDLDINLGGGQTEPLNNFESVARAIEGKYPHVKFGEKRFVEGSKKIEFIDEMIQKRHPVLVSITNEVQGRPAGCHIMPIVDASTDSYLLLVIVEHDGRTVTNWILKNEVERIHDTYPGGREVAYLDSVKNPTTNDRAGI